ncbi:ATP-dependent helicase [Deltaproteobacteria bacterium IMCC39524]|nr:ATP-dependent helicase [Deltaproteobacteria bacterium IMCC39524]
MSSTKNLISILDPLSKEQRAVVTHKKGHALVSAVAGSGKTQTLIQRVLYLLNDGVNKDKILVVMYNRDIKESFSARLEKACKPYGFVPPKVFTYHGLGKSICDRLVERGDLERAVYRTDNLLYRNHLMHALEKAAEDSEDKEVAYKDNEFISEFLGLIDRWKGDLLHPKEVVNSVDYEEIRQVFKDAYRYFEELRLADGFRTFADMIYDPAMAIRETPRIDNWVGNRYQHVLIDEYQDINMSQQELLQSVAGTKAEVMAVGDEDQCIYEWRGSRPDYMTGLFEQFFVGAKRYTLSNTYRFGHTLSCVANSVMYQNKKRTKKLCLSWNTTPQTKVKFYQQPDGDSNGLITKLVRQWVQKGRKHKESVILVRSWAMALEPEMELLAAGIPCIVGDKNKSYKSRPEIQALVGFMALALPEGLASIDNLNRRNDLFKSMLRYVELYLKRAQRKELISLLTENPTSYKLILEEAASSGGVTAKVKGQLLAVSKQWTSLADTLCDDMDACSALVQINHIADFKERVRKGHINKQAANDAVRTIEILMEHARSRGLTLAKLYDELSSTKSAEHGQRDAVLITSVHKAKGCEWPMVIVPKLEEGRFPHLDEKPDEDSVEQERRLFYVAITRAVERVNLIAPEDEYLMSWLNNGFFGSPQKREITASRFLYESGLSRARQVCKELYDGVVSSEVSLGEKEFLYQTYLRKIKQR